MIWTAPNQRAEMAYAERAVSLSPAERARRAAAKAIAKKSAIALDKQTEGRIIPQVESTGQ